MSISVLLTLPFRSKVLRFSSKDFLFLVIVSQICYDPVDRIGHFRRYIKMKSNQFDPFRYASFADFENSLRRRRKKTKEKWPQARTYGSTLTDFGGYFVLKRRSEFQGRQISLPLLVLLFPKLMKNFFFGDFNERLFSFLFHQLPPYGI